MLVEEITRVDLALSLQRQIDLRTGGRIRNLQVAAVGERVTITGTAPSYYAKQLALVGIQDVLGSSTARVALNIDVATAEVRRVEGRDATHGRP
jgi:hypothetical protein